MEHLASAYGGEDVAHSVVVAYFSVFVPRGFVSGLGGPESGFVYVLFVIGYKHSAAGGGYYFVAIVGVYADFAEGAAFFAAVCGA